MFNVTSDLLLFFIVDYFWISCIENVGHETGMDAGKASTFRTGAHHERALPGSQTFPIGEINASAAVFPTHADDVDHVDAAGRNAATTAPAPATPTAGTFTGMPIVWRTATRLQQHPRQ